MTDHTAPQPDFTSPIAGRIEVREPCPWCANRPMIPRTLMDEHVARLHPEVQTVAASAVQAPAADQTPLRDRIAEALATAEGWRFADGFKEQSPTWQGFLRQADAVMAVLPAPTDRASLVAGLRAAADEIAGIDFHPNARARSLDIAAGLVRRLRRMADEAQPAPHSCGNCGGVDPDTCLTNPGRPAAAAQQDGARP
jgi:hypothetical protein